MKKATPSRAKLPAKPPISPVPPTPKAKKPTTAPDLIAGKDRKITPPFKKKPQSGNMA